MSLSATRLYRPRASSPCSRRRCWRAAAPAAQLVEGKNYARITNPQPVETGKKIEVIEFFSYGCPHCAELEPYPRHVARQAAGRRRVPARARDVPAALGAARARSTTRSTRSATRSKLSPEVFKAIHGTGMALWDDKKFFDWAASKGLDRKKVEEVFDSFAIDGKMNRAKQHAQEYHIQSVPTVIVDGKFVTVVRSRGHACQPAGRDRRADREGARRAEELER